VSLYLQDKIIQLSDGTYVEFGLGLYYSNSLLGPWKTVSSRRISFLEDAMLLANGEILVAGEDGLWIVNRERTEMKLDRFGPPIQNFTKVFANNIGSYVASSEEINYHSSDGGEEWDLLQLPYANLNSKIIDQASWTDSTLFTTTSGGFALSNPPYTAYDFVDMPQGGPVTNFVTANNSVFTLNNAGSWRGTAAGDDFSLYPQNDPAPSSSSLHPSGAFIYVNTNGTWSRFMQTWANRREQLNWLNTDYRFLNDRIFRCQPSQWSISTNDGASWQDCNMSDLGLPADGLGNYPAPLAMVSVADSLYLSPANGKGVYVSSDGGFTWSDRTFNLSGETILSLAGDIDRRGVVASVADKSLFGYFPQTITNNQEVIEFTRNLLVYPNPASDIIQIEMPKHVVELQSIDLVSISTGQRLAPHFVNLGFEKVSIAVNHLPAGLYALHCRIEGSAYQARFIVL
jgi:hypothetical protein